MLLKTKAWALVHRDLNAHSVAVHHRSQSERESQLTRNCQFIKSENRHKRNILGTSPGCHPHVES